MAQPQSHVLCQGPLNFWVQNQWYQLTAVIVAHKDFYSLTLTKLPIHTWLSDPSQGVILDMSLSSVVAMESASVGTMDAAFLILLFTKRSTHVLSAVSEQERISWQEKFELIIGEEWKFKVTIPCQLDMKQECQGVLRFNTKRRTIVITYTQDSRQFPAVLYQWPLKSIKSFGANKDLLVLDTSNFSETGKSYFCVNTQQAEEILRVFREATGILPYTGDTGEVGRNSARFADIDRVKRAIEKNNAIARSQQQSHNDNGDDEIHYEIADDFEEISQKQRFSRACSHSNTSGISNVKSHQVPVKYPDTEILRHNPNQARMYRFPSPDPNNRDIHSHIHSVPVMEDNMAKAQVLRNRSNSPSNLAENPRRGAKETSTANTKRKSRSRNALRIISSGRSAPAEFEENSQCDPSSRGGSRPTSPHSFIQRAISKLKGPFYRSRDNLARQGETQLSPRSKSSGKGRNPVTAATTRPTQSTHAKLDKPIPPRHIPKQPSQPIIVQHPQPIEQPGHFVPHGTNLSPLNPPHYNLRSQCTAAINSSLPVHNNSSNQTAAFHSTQQSSQFFAGNPIPPQYAQDGTVQQARAVPQNWNQSPINPIAQQTAQWVQQHRMEAANYDKLNMSNPSNQLIRQNSQNQNQNQNQVQSHSDTSQFPHHVIRTSSPEPATRAPSPPPFKGPANFIQQRMMQQRSNTPTNQTPRSATPDQRIGSCDDRRDSQHYDHLSPDTSPKDSSSTVPQALPDILQPTQQPVVQQGMQPALSPCPENKIPSGGQQTPLALIIQKQKQQQQQQQQQQKSPDRKLRRNEAFRSKPSKRPPSIPPKPTLSPINSNTAVNLSSDKGVRLDVTSSAVGALDYLQLSQVVPQTPVTPPNTYPTTDC